MQGSYDRRVVITRRVEYVIDTPYGEPVEAKTLGVVLASIHRELGDRVQYDNAYHVRGEDGQVVLSFEVETRENDAGYVIEGETMRVVVTDPADRDCPVGAMSGAVRLNDDDELELRVPLPEVRALCPPPPSTLRGTRAVALVRNPGSGSDYGLVGKVTGWMPDPEGRGELIQLEVSADSVLRAAEHLGRTEEGQLPVEMPTAD